jgi:type II restriction enzyme
LDRTTRLETLAQSLPQLSDAQLQVIQSIVSQFSTPFRRIERRTDSNFIDERLLIDFGDVLRIHHCFSSEPFTKDKFEFALVRLCNIEGRTAQLATRGNRGHDITIDGTRFSLKTQADRNLRDHCIHISKFMELGRGHWEADIEDLKGLAAQFFAHMESYDRILSLRCLSRETLWHYELVEIPKSLLLLAKGGTYRVQTNSKQTPKPGYCDVHSPDGNLLFQLYFDGGTERKLQIKGLLKSECVVHADWQFNTIVSI